MVKLKVALKSGKYVGAYSYKNEINADNFKDIAMILNDLKNLNLPIDKAIGEFNSKKSDWDAVLD